MHFSPRRPRRFHAKASLILLTSSLLFVAGVSAQTATVSPAANATLAASPKQVVAELTQVRVITDAQGKEQLEAAPTVKPGDVIEYRVKYTNSGAAAVKDIKATLPIPEETEYLAKSGKPGSALLLAATKDGKFAAEPLMHTPSGKTKSEPVPYADYRTLQWNLGQLPFMPQFQVFGEAEQDVDHSDRHAVALGGSYAITDKTRLYGRYAFVDSLTSLQNVTGATQRNVALFGVESNYMEGARAYNEYRVGDVADGRSIQAAMGLRNTFKVTENLRLTGGYEQTQDLGASPASVTTTSSSAATGVTDSNARAIVGGFEYTLGTLRTVGTLEKRSASASDTLLGTLGASYRFEPDWTFLTRSVVNRTASTDTLLQMRQQFGLAYRPSGGADLWNALARYEHKYERLTAGANSTLVDDDSKISASDVSTISTLSTPGTSRTHIVSGNLNYNPARGQYWSARYAFRYTTLSDSITSSSYWAQLGHVRYTRDIAKDWDLGVQAGLLYGKGGAVQRTLGVEAGYQAMPNLWVSAGYNVLGLKDPDLAGADYTNRGLYMRLRFKFDEGTLGLQSPAVPTDGGATTQAATTGSGIGEVAAARAALAPVPGAVAARTWQAGQPLPARVEWAEGQLFSPGSAELSEAGRGLLDALANAIGPAGIGQVDVSVGHGDADAAHTGLWLARAGAIKRALAGHSPRAISVSVDSQQLAPATAAAIAANEAGVRPLAVAVVAARN